MLIEWFYRTSELPETTYQTLLNDRSTENSGKSLFVFVCLFFVCFLFVCFVCLFVCLYCCPLWHPDRLEDIKTLENVQRFFTRHIAGMEGADYWERLSRLKLQSLQRRRERYIIIHMWKLLHNLVPNDLNVEFYHRERLGWRARIPVLFERSRQSSKTIFDASFAVNGPKLWNILPKSVNSAVTLDSLKVHLGAFLESVPDCPPTSGYTAANANSMLNWCNDNQQGGLRQKL